MILTLQFRIYLSNDLKIYFSISRFYSNNKTMKQIDKNLRKKQRAYKGSIKQKQFGDILMEIDHIQSIILEKLRQFGRKSSKKSKRNQQGKQNENAVIGRSNQAEVENRIKNIIPSNQEYFNLLIGASSKQKKSPLAQQSQIQSNRTHLSKCYRGSPWANNSDYPLDKRSLYNKIKQRPKRQFTVYKQQSKHQSKQALQICNKRCKTQNNQSIGSYETGRNQFKDYYTKQIKKLELQNKINWLSEEYQKCINLKAKTEASQMRYLITKINLISQRITQITQQKQKLNS